MILAVIVLLVSSAAAQDLRPYSIQGDAIADSLTGAAGDAARGRAIVGDRQRGLCLLCHAGPFEGAHMHGNLAPDLRGAGARWTAGQLRLRLVDMRHVSPDTIMPSFYRTTGLQRVAEPWRDKPILSADEIEDVIAFLMTLQEG